MKNHMLKSTGFACLLLSALAAVPLSALIEGRGKSASVFVLAANGRSVHRVQVEVESIHRDTAYLATPLPSASRVVTSGAEFLKDGRAVIDNGQRTEQP